MVMGEMPLLPTRVPQDSLILVVQLSKVMQLPALSRDQFQLGAPQRTIAPSLRGILYRSFCNCRNMIPVALCRTALLYAVRKVFFCHRFTKSTQLSTFASSFSGNPGLYT